MHFVLEFQEWGAVPLGGHSSHRQDEWETTPPSWTDGPQIHQLRSWDLKLHLESKTEPIIVF